MSSDFFARVLSIENTIKKFIIAKTEMYALCNNISIIEQTGLQKPHAGSKVLKKVGCRIKIPNAIDFLHLFTVIDRIHLQQMSFFHDYHYITLLGGPYDLLIIKEGDHGVCIYCRFYISSIYPEGRSIQHTPIDTYPPPPYKKIL